MGKVGGKKEAFTHFFSPFRHQAGKMKEKSRFKGEKGETKKRRMKEK